MKMQKCDCGRYTLKKVCPACGEKTESPHPARFSPSDKYAKYRLEMKRRAGLL